MEQSTSSKPSTFRSLPLYEDLRKQDLIRLLKLDPSAASTDKSYKIKTFPIRKLPKYYALSYCWGSSERVTKIICNGQPLQISDHLSQGLRELQSLPGFTQKWFWIDQICVKQDNLDERSHQVKLMQEVYSCALSTVIWLGICDEPCEKAFSLAQDIFKILQANGEISKTSGMRRKIPPLKTFYEEELLSMNLPAISDQPWQELRMLLAKAWFRRMWIIQEFVLSREKPLLVYGGIVRN